MDNDDIKKYSNSYVLSQYIERITSKPELYSKEDVRNLMLISIAMSLADIADKMNETK